MSGDLIGAAALVSRFVIALVLLAAALPKLVDRHEFEWAVANYDLLPDRAVRPVAVWLPRVELAAAVALLLGVAVRIVSFTAAVLFLGFALAVAINLRRGRSIDCGCRGSVAPRTIGWHLVLSDIALAGVALLAALADPGVLSLAPMHAASASVNDTDAIAALFVAGLFVLGSLNLSSWLSVRTAAAGLRESMGRR